MGINLGSVLGIGGMVLGGIVGSFWGPGGTAVGIAIGGMLGGTAGSLLFPQRMDSNLPPPPKPRENRVQFSTYGATIPLTRGGVRLAGNIIYMQDVKRTKKTKKYRIEGVRFKDFTVLYSATVAVAFCRGEVTALQRIWVNGKVFADYRSADDPAYPGDGETATGNLNTTLARENVDFRVHYGGEDQAADETIMGLLGADETPAYRGVFYIVFINFPVGEYAGVPTFEVEVTRTSQGEIGLDYTSSDYWSGINGGEVSAWDAANERWSSSLNYSPPYDALILLTPVNGWNEVEYNPSTLQFKILFASAYTGTISWRLVVNTNTENGVAFTGTISSATYAALVEHTIEIDVKTNVWDIVNASYGGDGQFASFRTNCAAQTDYAITYISFVGQGAESYQPLPETLDTVVSEICEEAGLEAADIDVTALAADEVQGFQVPRLMPARTALEPLMAAYSFDAVEVDWALEFLPRGGASVATITAGELGAHADGAERPDPMVEIRAQEIELPTHLTLSYDSKALDYEPGTQRAVRVDKSVFTPQTVQLGIVMTEEHAKQTAEILLKQLWGGRHRYVFAVGPKYLKLAPGDVITVSGKEMRVVEMADRDGIVELSCESEPGGVYASAAEADDLTITPDDLTADAAVPEFLTLDIPTIDEDVGAAGLWVVLYDDTTGWLGGTIQRSADGGTTWEDVGLVDDTARGVVGDCDTTLADGIAGCIDYTAGLTVDLADSAGELASAADSELWEGANLCAVGSAAGGWEILQFKTATLVSGNTYTLTGLLRGLYGTERYMATHAAGELFVLLYDAPGLDYVTAPTEDIGASHLYRIVNDSETAGDASSHAAGALGLECYPPQGIHHGYNAAGDMVIAWRRGDRYEFADEDFPDGGDIEMSETAESYRVRIYDSGDTLKRTLTASAQTTTWTAAQIASDFPAGLVGAYLLIDQESALVSWGTTARYDL